MSLNLSLSIFCFIFLITSPAFAFGKSIGQTVEENYFIPNRSGSIDAGSSVESLGEEVCVEWNGFLGFLSQILELRNVSDSAIDAEVTLFDILGNAQDTFGLSLDPGIQFDVVINDLEGFATNTFGLVCAKITSGLSDSLDGQLSTYRFVDSDFGVSDFIGQSYDLAYVSELLPARVGAQHMTYNTFQPSGNLVEVGNFVAGWVQIINDEEVTQTGILRYYDAAGTEVRTETLSLSANQRLDIDIHSLGSSLIGLITWEPDSSAAKFRVRQNRYFFGQQGLSDLMAVVPISGKRGAVGALVSPFDTSKGFAAIELSNSSNTAVNISLVIRDAQGTVAGDLNFEVDAKETSSLVLNDFLNSGLGSVTVTSDISGSLIVNLIEYGLEQESASLQFANPINLSEPLSNVLRASYNNFLNQECRLRLVNVSSVDEEGALTLTRFDGTVVASAESFLIPANSIVDSNICFFETQEAYGEVRFEFANPGAIVGDVIRKNFERTVQFSGQLRP